MYLHSRSEFEDYHTFFSHIAVKLRGCTEVRFGSDDDKALVNAIEDCLVQSGVLGIHVLCACHLRNNVKDHLQDMVGLSKSDCDKFLNIIFGEQGLCKKCHEQLFDQKCEDILASVQDSVLHTYLQATIMPKLKKKVMQPMWLHGTNPDWTNNSESGNHVMKLVAGWKPQQLLDLVPAEVPAVQHGPPGLGIQVQGCTAETCKKIYWGAKTCTYPRDYPVNRWKAPHKR